MSVNVSRHAPASSDGMLTPEAGHWVRPLMVVTSTGGPSSETCHRDKALKPSSACSGQSAPRSVRPMVDFPLAFGPSSNTNPGPSSSSVIPEGSPGAENNWRRDRYISLSPPAHPAHEALRPACAPPVASSQAPRPVGVPHPPPTPDRCASSSRRERSLEWLTHAPPRATEASARGVRAGSAVPPAPPDQSLCGCDRSP